MSNQKIENEQKQRINGIDLLRGFAVYAVVILHSDEGITSLPPGWSEILHFSSFAVPFFLATSFYLGANRLYQTKERISLKARFLRLLIPYGFWTVFYLLYRALKYAIANEPEKLKHLFADPLSIIFFGGSAFHLYFLPLLFAGTLLIKFLEFPVRKQLSFLQLLLIGITSFLLYELVLISGNAFQNDTSIAFEPLSSSVFGRGFVSNPWIRFLLVEISWLIRCFPYVMTAIVLCHPKIKEQVTKLINCSVWIWLTGFILANAIGNYLLPDSLHEVARGYITLFLAIALSKNLKENSLIKNLGVCSFGIYLVHLFFVEVFQTIASRVYPSYTQETFLGFLVGVSLVIFAISWMTTLVLMKNKLVANLIFSK
jgi:peptidoglycan/LPS O-acetylase OafA/YrhL